MTKCLETDDIAEATPLHSAIIEAHNGTEVLGASITLDATIIDPATNQRLSGTGWMINVRFLGYDLDGAVSFNQTVTSSSPVVTMSLGSSGYPSDGEAHAYMAKIVSGQMDAVPQGLAGNSVQLTVGKTTRLLLNWTRDSESSNHTIQGWLKYESTTVPNNR